jgi:hypothetical protein
MFCCRPSGLAPRAQNRLRKRRAYSRLSALSRRTPGMEERHNKTASAGAGLASIAF